MPCNSDYMNASDFEINLSRVLLLIDELEGHGHPDPNDGAWRGYDRRAYNRHLSPKFLDECVRKLCERLTERGIRPGDSLELQVWWRDHQAADQERARKQAVSDWHKP